MVRARRPVRFRQRQARARSSEGSRRPRPSLALPLAVLLGAGAVLGNVSAQQPFDVALRDGLLSIRANDAPIGALAEALSGETGVSFVVTGDPAVAITTEIVDEPLDRAVAKLFPNHLLVRDGKSADAPITEVVLLLDDESGSGGGGEGFLPSGAPADEIVGGEEEFTQPEIEGAAEAMQGFVAAQQHSGPKGVDDGSGGDSLDTPREEVYEEEAYVEVPPEGELSPEDLPAAQ